MFEAVAGFVKAAARDGDDYPFVAGQAFGAVRRIAEGVAGHRDAVDPRLELRRNAEIIHWRADDDGFGREELLEYVGILAALCQVSERSGDKVGLDHCRRRVGRGELVGDRTGEDSAD